MTANINPEIVGAVNWLLDNPCHPTITPRLHVELHEIDEQRAKGWPDFHPEDFCHRCGGINAVWNVDSDRFNAALGPYGTHSWNGIVCVGCFVQLHELATGLTCSWQVSPLTHFSPLQDHHRVSLLPAVTP